MLRCLSCYCLYPTNSLQHGTARKLMVSQLFRTFCVYYGTQRCITVFRLACHLPMSRHRSIKSPAPSNFLKIHFNIIVQSTRRSSKWPYSFRFSHQSRVCSSPFPHTCYMTLHSHSWCDYSWNNCWVVQVMKFPIVQSPPSSITLSLLDRYIFHSTLFSNTFSFYSSLTARDIVSLYPYLCITVTWVIFCHR
jgi:hypothetical protein